MNIQKINFIKNTINFNSKKQINTKECDNKTAKLRIFPLYSENPYDLPLHKFIEFMSFNALDSANKIKSTSESIYKTAVNEFKEAIGYYYLADDDLYECEITIPNQKRIVYKNGFPVEIEVFDTANNTSDVYKYDGKKPSQVQLGKSKTKDSDKIAQTYTYQNGHLIQYSNKQEKNPEEEYVFKEYSFENEKLTSYKQGIAITPQYDGVKYDFSYDKDEILESAFVDKRFNNADYAVFSAYLEFQKDSSIVQEEFDNDGNLAKSCIINNGKRIDTTPDYVW